MKNDSQYCGERFHAAPGDVKFGAKTRPATRPDLARHAHRRFDGIASDESGNVSIGLARRMTCIKNACTAVAKIDVLACLSRP
ncbi:hypothetical protein BLAT2472_20347 [Burkholderia latens]